MKPFFLTTLLLVISVSLYSQGWVQPGAVWHYSYNNTVSFGFLKIEYTHDSLILDRNCQILRVTEFEFSYSMEHTIYLVHKTSLPDICIHSTNDTVFYLNDSTFNILYNFSAGPGEHWDLGKDTNQYTCSKSVVLVDSVGSMDVNSIPLKWLHVSVKPNSSVGFSGKIVERIGVIDGYLLPEECNCDSLQEVDFTDIKLSCYQDDELGVFNRIGKDCEYLLTTRASKLNDQSVIYPTVTDGLIYFQHIHPRAVKILDITGRLIDEITKPDISVINIATYPKGIYIIQIENFDGEIFTRKVIKKI